MSYMTPSDLYNPTKDALSCNPRESMTSVTVDMEEESMLWNMDLSDMLNASEKQRVGVGRSTSFDHQRRRRSDDIPEEDSTTATSDDITPTNSPMQKPRRMRPRRSVSFGKVEVRAFERVLGANPPICSGGGPSLGLGWNYSDKKAVDVDKYGKSGSALSPLKSLLGGSKKSTKDCLMTVEKREKIAKKLGFTERQIRDNAKLMEKVNKQRKKTVNAFLEEQYEQMFIMERARQAAQMNVIGATGTVSAGDAEA